MIFDNILGPEITVNQEVDIVLILQGISNKIIPLTGKLKFEFFCEFRNNLSGTSMS